MDDSTIDLVRQLLTRAGMAMEDACGIAVAPPTSPPELSAAVDNIVLALDRVIRMARAAQALTDEHFPA